MERWTDELLALMVSKLAERKRREAAPARRDERTRRMSLVGADPDRVLEELRLANAMMGGSERVT